jgi:uncharacterized protein (DUF2267 family)
MTKVQDHIDVIDTTVQKTYTWINEIGLDLGGLPRTDSYDILRAFLHVLRDRLIIDEGAQLSAQLPLLVRGIYYEGWDPSKVPVKMDRAEFVDRFRSEAALKPPVDPERALQSAANTVRRHITEGEYQEVISSLPQKVRELLTI